MKTWTPKHRDHHLAWFRKTAGDVMMSNPVSISQDVLIPDAADFLTAKRISAVPVIDDAGRPVGVISRADIVRHARINESCESEFRNATVDEIMTPVAHFVRPDTPLMSVIDDLLACKVYRLFVVDDQGVLIGVISTPDVLRSLLPETATPPHTLAESVP